MKNQKKSNFAQFLESPVADESTEEITTGEKPLSEDDGMEVEAPEDFFKSNFEHVVKVNRETQQFNAEEDLVEEDDRDYEIDRESMKLLRPELGIPEKKQAQERVNRF